MNSGSCVPGVGSRTTSETMLKGKSPVFWMSASSSGFCIDTRWISNVTGSTIASPMTRRTRRSSYRTSGMANPVRSVPTASVSSGSTTEKGNPGMNTRSFTSFTMTCFTWRVMTSRNAVPKTRPIPRSSNRISGEVTQVMSWGNTLSLIFGGQHLRRDRAIRSVRQIRILELEGVLPDGDEERLEVRRDPTLLPHFPLVGADDEVRLDDFDPVEDTDKILGQLGLAARGHEDNPDGTPALEANANLDDGLRLVLLVPRIQSLDVPASSFHRRGLIVLQGDAERPAPLWSEPALFPREVPEEQTTVLQDDGLDTTRHI